MGEFHFWSVEPCVWSVAERLGMAHRTPRIEGELEER
jgi:hypothetical protein